MNGASSSDHSLIRRIGRHLIIRFPPSRVVPFFGLLILIIAIGLSAELRGFTVTAQDQPLSLSDPAELKSLKFRQIGPAWGGRVSRAVGVSGDPNTYYAATASGGVWKSCDGGLTWKPVFDDQPVSSIGSLAIAPSDPNIVYVGSGEANIRGNVAAGNGIYRSWDAGKTWTHVWKQEGQIGTIVVHPTNPDIALAAVLGHAFGPNSERGIYRTADGGTSWHQVLGKDENTGASDVALDPSNPNIVFAGLWQTRRSPWHLQSGGPGSGLYMSRNGGDTWTQLTGKGLPAGIWGKVGVAVAPSDGRRIYALIEAEQGGLFRSDDGGDTWTRMSADRLLRQRAWYYSTVTVHPENPNELWCPQVPMLKSIDGGKTFQIIRGFHHGDHHDLWIDPRNPKRMIASNDGGVDISTDGGETWYAPALPIGQFYHISTDSRVPFHVAGAMQDIGTAQGPSHSLSSRGIRNTDWYGVGGGEAGHVVSDQSDPNIVYAGEYGGYISRYDHRTRQAQNISIYPENPSGHGAEDLRIRFQWTAPIAISPHDPKGIYHGGNILFRTDNGGQTWGAISPDLTRNDASKQQWSGGPITGDNTGVEVFCTIFSVAESPLQKGLIWAGSDDGLVHITLDGGKTWKNVTGGMPGFPEWGTVSMIEPSRFEAGTAYVVVDAHRLDNMRPYLYKTADFGKSWRRLDGALPQDVYLHAVREDVQRADILYLGTERGVAYTTDGGASWRSLKLNFPRVAVHDLVVNGNSLVVGTMGRSIWIFDHLSVLREFSPSVTGSQIHLFSVDDAVRWRFHSVPADMFSGENPPARALIYYWLKDAPRGEVAIDILDSQNRVIKSLSSQPRKPTGHGDNLDREEEELKRFVLSKEAGVQVALWNLDQAGAEMIQDAKLDAGNPMNGPMVVPGTYQIRLTVDGQSASSAVKVLPDPRVGMSAGDLEKQISFALSLRDEITRLSRLVAELRSVRQQLVNRNELLRNDVKAATLVKDSAALTSRLDQLEAQIHNPKAEVVYDILAMHGGARLYSRLSALLDWSTDSDGLPTQGLQELFREQKNELDRYEQEFMRLLDHDLADLNKQAKESNMPHIIRGSGK